MARRRVKREDALKKVVLGAQLDAARRVAGLFKGSSEPGYNRDAAVPWKEATVATRAAIELTKGTMAAERAKAAAGGNTTNFFGLVMGVPRIESGDDWEKMAKRVEAGENVIDVPALPAKGEE